MGAAARADRTLLDGDRPLRGLDAGGILLGGRKHLCGNQVVTPELSAAHSRMKLLLFLTAVLEIVIIAPTPPLERWQSEYRAKVRGAIQDFLPENPNYLQERALLREICALPDSAYRE